MAPSQLRQLKASLSSAGIIGPRKSRKQPETQNQLRGSEHDGVKRSAALKAIRDQFNPYEVRTRPARAPKHEVLRRSHPLQRARNSDSALRPGLTKAAGEDLRRRTLLPEIQQLDRVSSFVDNRADRRITGGAGLEGAGRVGRHGKSGSLFDLEDSDEEQYTVTHLGRELSIGHEDSRLGPRDGWAAPGPSSPSPGPEQGHLKRKQSSDFDEDKLARPVVKKSKTEIMKEVMAKSKLHKWERQKAKDEDEDAREAIDRQLPELMSILNNEIPSRRYSDVALPSKASVVDYDAQVKQLAFDKRSQPTQRIKTEMEREQERLEHLRNLESQRQLRMQDQDLENFVDSAEGEDSLLGRLDDDMHKDEVLSREDEDDFDLDEQLVLLESGSHTSIDLSSGSSVSSAPLGRESDIESFKLSAEDDLATILHDGDSNPRFGPVRSAKPSMIVACPQDVDSFSSLVSEAGDGSLIPIIQNIRLQYQYRSSGTPSPEFAAFPSVLVDYFVRVLQDNVEPSPSVIDGVLRQLHSLAKTHTSEVAQQFRLHMMKFQEARAPAVSRSDAILMKAIGSIFPTSGCFHPLTTPALLIMARYLNEQTTSQRSDDVALGLYICAACLDFQQSSARFMPEVSNYLSWCISSLLNGRRVDPAHLGTIVRLLRHAALLWCTYPAFIETFTPFISLLEQNPDGWKDLAPVRDIGSELQKMIGSACQARQPLLLHNHKPLAIKTCLPKFEDQFDPRRIHDPDQERREASKLRAEYKRERKGAIKELRKDANFLAREGLKAKKVKDAAYDTKYRKLIAEIQRKEGHEKNLYEKEKRLRKSAK